MDNHLTDIDIWRNIQENDETYQRIMELFIEYYQGGKFRNKKYEYIKENTTHIATHLNGDIRNLFAQCNGNERMMLNYLRKNIKGIRVKVFWLLREMRINGVWDIDGQYCCVPDKQVGKALERWHYIDSYNSKLSTHIRCSQIVWNYFHEMYDFPVFHYARTHSCNSRKRICAECLIMDCANR